MAALHKPFTAAPHPEQAGPRKDQSFYKQNQL